MEGDDEMRNRPQVDEIIKQLEGRTEPQALSPKQIWRADLHEAIAGLDWNGKSADPSVVALMAGLHLWNDNLYASHSLSQQIEHEPTGDYWHAIMHRMEQDYWNSKYWYRHVGNHPVKQAMSRKAAEYLQQHADLDAVGQGKMASILKQFRDKQGWNSSDFVDLVNMQESGQGSEAARTLLEGLQQIELRALLDFSYQRVYGN
jgi:hypothetical protein